MTFTFPQPAKRRLQQSEDRRQSALPAPKPRTAGFTRPPRRQNDAGRPQPPHGGSAAIGLDGGARFARQAAKQVANDAGSPSAGQGGRSPGQEAPALPGIKPVLELLQSAPERVDAVFLRKGRHGKDMERIVDLCRSAGVRFSLLDPAAFARVYEGHSQGVVARLFEAGFADLDFMLAGVMDAPLPLVLVLDQVQDPGNAGTLARTLYALGGAGLVAPRHNGVYLGAAAAKAAAGALDKLPVSKVANLGQAVDSAKKSGFTVYGAISGYGVVSQGDRAGQGDAGLVSGRPVADLFSLRPRLPAMLILGSEEGGIRAGMEKRCDSLIRIPLLRDFDSLNVAQAGGIIISWFAHQATRDRAAP